MKIPEGAKICPYCHTESPDIEWSTMEIIILMGVAVLLAAIILLLTT